MQLRTSPEGGAFAANAPMDLECASVNLFNRFENTVIFADSRKKPMCPVTLITVGVPYCRPWSLSTNAASSHTG